MAVVIAIASAAAGGLIARTGARPLLIVSALLVTLALAGLSRIDPGSGYASTVLSALLVAGLGIGLAFVALTTVALGAASKSDSGVAAGLFNAAQQLGGALGHPPSAAAVTEGGRPAFWSRP